MCKIVELVTTKVWTLLFFGFHYSPIRKRPLIHCLRDSNYEVELVILEIENKKHTKHANELRRDWDDR